MADDVEMAARFLRRVPAEDVQSCAIQCCVELFERAAEDDGFRIEHYGMSSIARNAECSVFMVVVGLPKGATCDDALALIRAEILRRLRERGKDAADAL